LKAFTKSSFINFFAKTTLTVVLLALLYYNLTQQNSLDQMVALFQSQLKESNRFWLLLAIILLPFNWLAETYKWYPSLRKYEPISLFRAYQAVLAGVSFSLFTPNRVGEYGGRVIFVSADQRWKAFIINIVGNFAQILVILTFGLAGALWLFAQYGQPGFYLLWVGVGFAVLAIAIITVAYFNIDIFIPLARRIPFMHRIKRYVKDIALLRQFHRAELAKILFWSALRFLIYSTQYYCVLRFYAIEVPVFQAFSGICSIFLLQTGVPLPPILGLVARGNVAVQIFGLFGANPLSALASTFTLWIINLILPSLTGLFFVLHINLARLFGYEKK
jgi:Lysylphosphatidylglycerol synthase TM region